MLHSSIKAANMPTDNPTLEELIVDESFINYCLQRDQAAVHLWEAWLQEHVAHQERIDEAKCMVLALAYRPSAAEIATERARLLAFIAQKAPNKRRTQLLRLVGRWVAAASIALAIGLGATYYFRRPAAVDAISVAWIKQTVPAGKLMHLRLADGTEVRLTSATTFSYPENFSSPTREVYLQGEAFFDVAHADNKPFIIRSGDFAIRVLGTAFNVHAFEEDAKLQVSLFRGKVEVSNGASTQILEPGQSFVYDKRTKTASIQAFDEADEQARISGVLFFDRADFAELARKLSRKYGIVVPPNSDVNITFSGRIAHETIEHVIEKLNYTTSYRFLLDSNTLIVKHK